MFTSDRTADGDTFFISSPGFGQEHTAPDTQPTYYDPLDDVFGSAPTSPTTAGDDLEHDTADVRHAAGELSDVPRLRSIHVTNGYREGIAAGKERSIQAGFDEGYALGAEYGVIAGWVKGVLEGLLSITTSDEQRAVLQTLLKSAHDELDISNLFSDAYFGPDGIWIYEVPSSSSDVTFRVVASAHPLLVKWRKVAADNIEMLK